MIDDKVVGEANRFEVDELKKTYSNYNVSKAGFSYDFNTTNLTNGTHKLVVRAIGIDGTTKDYLKDINVMNDNVLKDKIEDSNESVVEMYAVDYKYLALGLNF